MFRFYAFVYLSVFLFMFIFLYMFSLSFSVHVFIFQFLFIFQFVFIFLFMFISLFVFILLFLDAIQGDQVQLWLVISFSQALENRKIIKPNNFCQPYIWTFWYFDVLIQSGEEKLCLSGFCQNSVIAPYFMDWEPR